MGDITQQDSDLILITLLHTFQCSKPLFLFNAVSSYRNQLVLYFLSLTSQLYILQLHLQLDSENKWMTPWPQ